MARTTPSTTGASEPTPRVIIVTAPPSGHGRLVFRAFILGALMGAVLALIKARQSGATTRAQIRSWAENACQQALDLASEARVAVEDFAAWAADEEDDLLIVPEPGADTLTLAGASDASSAPAAPASPEATTTALPTTPPPTINEATTTALPAAPAPPDDTPTAPLPRLPRQ